MKQVTRKWIAKLYDQRGSINVIRKGKHKQPFLRFSKDSSSELSRIRYSARSGSIFPYGGRDHRREGEYNLVIAERRAVLELCVLIYPYLKVEEKKDKMREIWHEVGWCICNDVRR